MTTFTEPPESPLGRALARRSGGDIDGAIEMLLAAAGESLADANLAVTLGKMLAETGQYRRADPWFRHAMKLAPDDVVVRMGYGAFLGEVGQFEEARTLLDGVLREVRILLASAAPEERASLVGLEGFIASTEINLARAAFEAGDSALARELVGPWLADEDHWPSAHAVLADVVDRDGLDPTQLAEEGLASGQVSPYMACHLLERIVDAEVCDFSALEDLVARADACFAFDWKWVEPPLVAVFARARQLFAHAVMRGVVAAAACPHLAALVAQPGPATDGSANDVDDDAAASSEDEDEDEDEDDVDAGSDDEDRSLEAFARAFIGHWASMRDRIAAGEDVALDRVNAFASEDRERQLALAREYYALGRAQRLADLSIDEAVELIAPWAETASDLIDAYGCVETIRALVAAEYVLAVYGKWVLPVRHAGAVGVWEATCGGVGNGGSFWLRKTTGEPFAEDEAGTFVRWIEEEFESDAEEMDDDARVSVYPEDACVIAGDASCLGEEDEDDCEDEDEDDDGEDDDGEDDDGEDEGEDGEDEDEGLESAFEGVLRLAGWNDSEPGIQIILGRRSGLWCFQTGDADYPAVPEAIAESLVALFERGVAGIAPRRTLRPLAIDRYWLVEGAGATEVVRFDVIAPDQWPLVNAAMAVFGVHAVVVAAVSEPAPPFAVLIASGPDRFAAIEACWSDDGFLYRRKGDAEGTPDSIEAWSEGTTTDLASLVPDLDRLMPIVLHPLAAWELLEPVRALQAGQTSPCRRDWLEFAEKAIATHAPATLLPPITKSDYEDVDEDVDDDQDDEDDEDEDDEDKEDDVDRAIAELGAWNASDPTQWTVRERLVALAGFGAALTDDNLARLAGSELLTQTPLANGRTMLAEAPPCDLVTEFIGLGYKYGWVTPRVRWMRWHETPDALRFDDPECLARANLDDLVRLVTTLIVRERFVGNSLHYSILGGFVRDLVARAAILLAELDAGVPHTTTLFGDVPRG